MTVGALQTVKRMETQPEITASGVWSVTILKPSINVLLMALPMVQYMSAVWPAIIPALYQIHPLTATPLAIGMSVE